MRDDDIYPDPTSKAVRSKVRRALDQVGLSGLLPRAGQRLPPGQRRVAALPVLDLGVQPTVRCVDWRLTVAGQIENALAWDWDTFMAQPQTRITRDIHCVTNWSAFDQEWEGVSARHLLDLVRPKASATTVMLRSYDGYSANVPLETFAGDDVLLAHRLNGEPLDKAHGGPVRVVIPRLYFWKSAKWLRHITVMDRDAPGYWEARGYHNHGDPWKEERYD